MRVVNDVYEQCLGRIESNEFRGEVLLSVSARGSESISHTSLSDSLSEDFSMFSRANRTTAEYCRESSLEVGVTCRRNCKITREAIKLGTITLNGSPIPLWKLGGLKKAIAAATLMIVMTMNDPSP